MLRVWLNRRKALCLVLLFSIIFLGMGLILGLKEEMPALVIISLSTGALAGAALALIAVIMAAFVPKSPSGMGCVAIALISLVVLAIADEYGFLPDATLVRILLWSVLFGVLFWLVSAPTLEGVLRRNVVVVAHAKSSLSREDLWPWIIPTPDLNMAHIAPDAGAWKWIEPGRRFTCHSVSNDVATMEVEIETLQWPGQIIIRWQTRPVPGKKQVQRQGRQTIRFNPLKNGCEVDIRLELAGFSLLLWALQWLDDGLTRRLIETIHYAQRCDPASRGHARSAAA
ncbi:hypothetical protein [Pseudogemmobacter bohemicus]|uniref:hypothetical protein n=1 Tax=Pseudogemmobacter bohemicus TaxID=2250708 RepID=UPI0013007612|nr:hypothetical protein [Pseudogemmobacter bohemicus]